MKNRFKIKPRHEGLLIVMLLAAAAAKATTITPATPAAFQAAVSSAKSGDVINLSFPVTYGTAQLQLGSFAIVGTGAAELDFTPPKGTANQTEQKCFGILIASGANHPTITGVKLRSTNGIAYVLGATTGLTFERNDVQWGTDGNYYSRLALYCNGGMLNASVQYNTFHDSLTSDRTWEIWGANASNFDNNLYANVVDGGHLLNMGDDVSFSYNRGTGIHRSVQEVQNDKWPAAYISKRFRCVGNVFYDFNNPYYDTFLSLPAQLDHPVITDNYLRYNCAVGTFGADGSGIHRGSYGIEAPQPDATTALIARNIIGSQANVAGISCPAPNTPVDSSNKFYGTYSWYVVGGEPGALGTGSGTAQPVAGPLSAMPAPPAATTQPIEQPQSSITGLSATAAHSSVSVTYQSLTTPNVARFTSDGKSFPFVSAPKVTTTGFTDSDFSADQIANTWRVYYSVGGLNSGVVQIGIAPATQPSQPDTSAAQIAALTAQVKTLTDQLAAANSKLAQIAAIAK